MLRYVLPAYPAIIGDIAKPGVVEPGYNGMPVKAMYSLSPGLAGGARPTCRRSPCRCCCCIRGSITSSSRSTRRSCATSISSTDVTEIWLENSYHVATLDNDAEEIFTSSVEFIEKVTASLP